MLATCVVNGWSHASDYLGVEHPLQQCITDTIDELCEVPHVHIGVDGCGAPAHVMSLISLARSFRNIANGAAGAAGPGVARAVVRPPVCLRLDDRPGDRRAVRAGHRDARAEEADGGLDDGLAHERAEERLVRWSAAEAGVRLDGHGMPRAVRVP